MYPFGYGLNYGKAEVVSANVSDENITSLSEGCNLTLEVEVTNKGQYVAEEVLQVYVRNEETPYEVLNHKLGAFKRVSIQPDETKHVTITVPAKAFTVVNQEGKRIFDGKEATISVGFSQPDERSVELMGAKPKKLVVPFSR